MTTVRWDIFTALFCVLVPVAAQADGPSGRLQIAGKTAADVVSIGDRIPSLEFKDIRYLPRTLDELGQQKAFVLVFTNTTCPLVQRYMSRLKSHLQLQPSNLTR